MTPNKSDSGELRKAIDKKLYRFADYIKHHERTGLGGPDNQGKILTELVDLVTAHIQAVGEEILGEDDNRSTDARGTICNPACHAIAVNQAKEEQRARLAQYLGEKDV